MLPLSYQGEKLEFEVRAYQPGYFHRVEVCLEDIAVQFELDDEQNYRALAAWSK